MPTLTLPSTQPPDPITSTAEQQQHQGDHHHHQQERWREWKEEFPGIPTDPFRPTGETPAAPADITTRPHLQNCFYSQLLKKKNGAAAIRACQRNARAKEWFSRQSSRAAAHFLDPLVAKLSNSLNKFGNPSWKIRQLVALKFGRSWGVNANKHGPTSSQLCPFGCLYKGKRAIETIPHLLDYCLQFKNSRIVRHDIVLKKLGRFIKKRISTGTSIIVNSMATGSAPALPPQAIQTLPKPLKKLRPDIAIWKARAGEGGEEDILALVEVAISGDKSTDTARDEKIQHYEALTNNLQTQLFPIIFGSRGTVPRKTWTTLIKLSNHLHLFEGPDRASKTNEALKRFCHSASNEIWKNAIQLIHARERK
jgi:hypothetical protein